MQELGGNARAITLMASQLGPKADMVELQRRIRDGGVSAITTEQLFNEPVPAIFDKKCAQERLLSSLNLTLAAAENENPDAAILFDVMGAFPGGLAQQMLPMTEQPWLQAALEVLLQHHLLSLHGEARRLSQAAPVSSMASLRLKKRASLAPLWPVLQGVYQRLTATTDHMYGLLGTTESALALRWLLLEEGNLLQSLHTLCEEGSTASAELAGTLITGMAKGFELAGRAKTGLQKLGPILIAFEKYWPQQQAAALANRAMGDLSLREDALTGARQHYDKALAIFTDIDDKLGQANTLQMLGLCQLSEGNWPLAFKQMLAALHQHEAIDNQLGCAACYAYLQRIAMQAGQTGQAMAFSSKALNTLKSIGDRFGQQIVYTDLAQCLLPLDMHLGLAAYYLAWQIAQDIHDPAATRLGAIFTDHLKPQLPETDYAALMQTLETGAQSMLDAHLAEIDAKVAAGEIDLFAPPPENNHAN